MAVLSTIPAWLVLFDCGHAQHPLRCYCRFDDEGHAPEAGPPVAGEGGWCGECRDIRSVVDVVDAAPLDAYPRRDRDRTVPSTR